MSFDYNFRNLYFAVKNTNVRLGATFNILHYAGKKQMTVWFHAFLTILTGKTVFYSIQYNNYWNKSLAASDIFSMFTQSINSIVNQVVVVWFTCFLYVFQEGSKFLINLQWRFGERKILRLRKIFLDKLLLDLQSFHFPCKISTSKMRSLCYRLFFH